MLKNYNDSDTLNKFNRVSASALDKADEKLTKVLEEFGELGILTDSDRKLSSRLRVPYANTNSYGSPIWRSEKT